MFFIVNSIQKVWTNTTPSSGFKISTFFLKFEVFMKFIFLKTPFVSKFLLNYRSSLVKRSFMILTESEITIGESIFLKEIVKGIERSGPIIEIGTLFGKSTIVIATSKIADHELITIDNYSWNPLGLPSNIHLQVTSHFLSYAIDKLNVKVLNIDKEKFYTQYSGKAPSLVFLDAIHTYNETKKDILWAKNMKAKLICGHDYSKEKHPEVVIAVNEFGGPQKLVETLWVL